MHIINLNNENILIGAEWENITPPIPVNHPFFINYLAKKKAISAKKEFGYSLSNNSERTGSYCLIQEDEIESIQKATDTDVAPKDILSGEAILFDYINENITKENDIPSNGILVFIKSFIVNGNIYFWVVSFDQSKNLFLSSDGKGSHFIVEDAHNVISRIQTYKIAIDTVSLCFLQDDVETYYALNGFDDKKITIESKNFFEFIKKNKKKYQLKQYYKESKLNKNVLVLPASLVVLSSVAYVGYNWYEVNSNSELIDIVGGENLNQKLTQYKKINEENKPQKTFNDSLFINKLTEDFINDYEKSLYTGKEIARVFYQINKSIPEYLVGWHFDNIFYKDNAFYVSFSRQTNQKGVYFILDNYVDYLNSLNDYIKLQPYELQNKGNLRIYRVAHSVNPKRYAELNKIKNTLVNNNTLSSNLYNKTNELIKLINGVANELYDIDEMSFFDSYVFNEKINKIEDLGYLYDKLKKAENDFSKTVNGGGKENLFLPQDYTLGNIMDFVSMMQIDSMFAWTFPVKNGIYPSEKNLKTYNPKIKKKTRGARTKQNERVYSHAVESYSVKISNNAGDNNEEGKVKTYGVPDMLKLGEIIDKPFVTVQSAVYDKNSEDWEFVISFYRRTNTYYSLYNSQ
jgi:hypothetical protein